MKREKDIRALLEQAKKELPEIEAEYRGSLAKQEISENLKISVKRYLGDLRSALDYVAHDIYEKYSGSSRGEKIYFPIDKKPGTFVSHAKDWFPGLESGNKGLLDYLDSVQPDKKPENKWLKDLDDVNNDSKHHNLTEQVRKETQQVKVTLHETVSLRDTGSVVWNPAQVKFGKGVFIGGVPVNPVTQMPEPSSTQKVEKITWVDFRFKETDVSALALLKQSLTGVEKIFEDILILTI